VDIDLVQRVECFFEHAGRKQAEAELQTRIGGEDGVAERQGCGLQLSGVGKSGIVVEDLIFFVEVQIIIEQSAGVGGFCAVQVVIELAYSQQFCGIISGGSFDGLVEPGQ